MTSKPMFRLMTLFLMFSYSTCSFSSESFSTEVEGPYFWLEDSENPMTILWLDEQKARFNDYVSTLSHRDEVKERLQELCKLDAYTTPVRSGNNYFFMRRLVSEEQFSIYVQNGIDGNPKLLLNPQEHSVDGPAFIQNYSISPDGNLLAYGISENGSDWVKWHFRNILTNEQLEDVLENIKYTSIVWSSDSLGFYYSCYNDQGIHGLYYHTLGTKQSVDKLIYQKDSNNQDLFYSPFSSSDGCYLMLGVSQFRQGLTSILCLDLQETDGQFFEVISNESSIYSFICNKGKDFYFLTNHKAPLKRLIVIDIKANSLGGRREIIPEGEALIDQIIPVGENFLVSFIEDVKSRLAFFDAQGVWVKNLSLPDYGTVHFAGGDLHAKEEDAAIFFSYANFVQPTVIYRYLIKTDFLDIFKKPQPNFDLNDYETKQIFYPSKDGTLVPMYIIHKKGLVLNGSNNAMLYGYGGFNIGIFPFFSTFNIAWMERGGILAVANIRGGNEYGEKWHKAGMREKKQNCFDDFISAAEWLIGNQYTRSSKLAIRGLSNGGLLVAACVNQKPDLFGAANVGVGVLDMLRFHLFTVGSTWIKEYGNPEDPADYNVLLGYSPYHNVKPRTHYPATLVTTGDSDDRVVPLHSYKYTAVLQESQGGSKPILLRVDSHAGHGFGKPTSQIIDESADILSFFIQELQ